MTSKQSVERLSGALEHALTHFYQHRDSSEAAPTPEPTIALSREAGVPDSEIAHEVGQRLGWPVYDHELLERIAEERHLRPSVLRKVDERPAAWIMERLETFLAQPPITEPAYVEHLIETLLSLSAHGRCVVVGRGSAHLLPERTTLRVRLIAPLWDRINHLVRHDSLSHPDAGRRVSQIDRERNEFVRRHFHKDATEVSQYDLVLNCARFAVVDCADVIVEALHRREAHARTPEGAGTT
jgi:cytidylate kinase